MPSCRTRSRSRRRSRRPPPPTISQFIVDAGREPADKRAVLRALIRGATDFKNAIIFCNRKRDVATLERSLSKHGFNAGALHGDMDQRSRTQTLDDFRKDKLKLLVASDVAARGLDIRPSATSSISTCRPTPRTTSTASAAPAAPG